METALVKFDWWDLDQVRDRGLVFVSHISEEYSKKHHTKMNIMCYRARQNEWEDLDSLARVMPAPRFWVTYVKST